jgi:hypothetical protein
MYISNGLSFTSARPHVVDEADDFVRRIARAAA